MRGLPGSGKTFFVNNFLVKDEPSFVVCSADHFFEKDVGGKTVYNFSYDLLSEAHQFCKDKFVDSVNSEVPLVIVDNTCVKYYEYDFYVSYAEEYGYEVSVIEVVVETRDDLRKIVSRQQHNVLVEKILEMWWKWETDPLSMKIKVGG